ncbi:MAG: MFS transporter [Cyanobacteria bacterium J06635_15]
MLRLPPIHKLKQLGLLGSLYTSQFIPNVFFTVAIPVYLRSLGATLETVGLLSILFIPWGLKVLWAPLVDRYGFTRWGHYRVWIFGTQSLAALLIAICALLDLQAHLGVLVGFMFVIAILCATQDIATDALAVGLLPASDRGLVNGVQSIGGYLGAIIGAGGMLILLDRWAWTPTMLTLALVMMVSTLPLLTVRERLYRQPMAARSASLWGYCGQQIKNFYQRPGMKAWLLVLLLYTIGGAMGHAMLRPLMVDLGFSLSEVGWLLGIASYATGILGAIAAIPCIYRLGRKQSLILFAGLKALALLAFLFPTVGTTTATGVYLVVLLFYFVMGLISTVMYTVFMDKSEQSVAGFDYSFQTSVTLFSEISGSAISGFLVTAMGYPFFFILCSGVSLLSLVVIRQGLGNMEPAVQAKLSSL